MEQVYGVERNKYMEQNGTSTWSRNGTSIWSRTEQVYGVIWSRTEQVYGVERIYGVE